MAARIAYFWHTVFPSRLPTLSFIAACMKLGCLQKSIAHSVQFLLTFASFCSILFYFMIVQGAVAMHTPHQRSSMTRVRTHLLYL